MVDKEFESRDDEYQINFSSSGGELARFLSLFMHSSRRILSLARATLNQERESIRGDRTYRGLCDFEKYKRWNWSANVGHRFRGKNSPCPTLISRATCTALEKSFPGNKSVTTVHVQGLSIQG